MAGLYGVNSIKNIMSMGKIGVISVIQAAAKDGFQARDVLAPLSSQTFLDAAARTVDDFASVLPEWNELDVWDGIELGKHAYACWVDIKTELSHASSAARRKVA